MSAQLHRPVPADSFELRRVALWYANRRWIVASVALIACAALLFGNATAPAEFGWALGLCALALGRLTVRGIVRALNRLYRYPNCGTRLQ